MPGTDISPFPVRAVRTGRSSPAGRRVPVLVVLAGLLGAACTGGGPGDPPDLPTDAGGGPVEVDPEAAEQTLDQARLDDPSSMEELEAVMHSESAVAVAAEMISSGATGDAAWVAAYVYANAATDPAPLLELLDSEQPEVRLMAAAGLLARGRVEGFAPLIEALEDEEEFAGSEPRIARWEEAASVLVRFTGDASLGPPFDASPSQRATARERWSSWLEENRDALRFDAGTGLWTVG